MVDRESEPGPERPSDADPVPEVESPDVESPGDVDRHLAAGPDDDSREVLPGHGLFDGPRHETVPQAPRSRRLGVVTFALSVSLLALDGVALALLAADAVTGAATFALITLLASVVVGVIALLAVAMRRGRGWGVAAVLLSVLANPFVLVWVIGRFVASV